MADFLTTLNSQKFNYGTTPKQVVAEQNQTYFAYWNGVGGTGPEIIDNTAFWIKYLIDINGNVINPEPSENPDGPEAVPLYNLKDNFEVGKRAIVKLVEPDPNQNTLSGYRMLTGYHTISHVGRIELLMTTEIGTNIEDWVEDVYLSVPGSEGVQDLTFLGRSSLLGNDLSYNATAGNGNWSPLYINYISQNGTHFAGNPSPGNLATPVSYYNFETTSSATALTQVGFRYQGNFYKVSSSLPTLFEIRIVVNRDGGAWDYDDPNNILASQILDFGDGSSNILRAELSTDLLDFGEDNLVRVVAKATAGGSQINLIDYSTGTTGIFSGYGGNQFSAYQNPISLNQEEDGLTIISSNYWNLYNPGDTTPSDTPYIPVPSGSSLLKMGEDMYDAYLNAIDLGVKAILPTGSALMDPTNPASFFSPIVLPFIPQVGDFIRFEYNPNKIHTITEMFVTENNNVLTGERMYLRVVPQVAEGTQEEHFTIYRIINDGLQVILDVPKDVPGVAYTGLLLPEHTSPELLEKLETLIQDLTQKEIIN